MTRTTLRSISAHGWWRPGCTGRAFGLFALVVISAGAVHAAAPLRDAGLARGLLVPHVQRADRLRGLPDTFGAGVCVLDANRDLRPDLLILSGSGSTRHYGRWNWWSRRISTSVHLNAGARGFFPVPLQSSDDHDPANEQGCAVGDLDNDGDDDIFISTTGRDQLWRNDGEGRFTPVEGTAVTARSEWTTGTTLVDVNGDGLLDLYVGGFIDYQQNARVFESFAGLSQALAPGFNAESFEAVPNRLYINQGDFRWVDVTEESGVMNHSGRTLGTYWLDVNGDLRPDLVELNTSRSGNRIHVQRSDGRFHAVPRWQRIVEGKGVRTMALTDLDHDEHPDLVFGTELGTPLLVRHDMHEDSTWRRRERSLRTVDRSTWGVLAADFDNDGANDLFAANGFSTPDMDAPTVSLGQGNDLLLAAAGDRGSESSGNAMGMLRSSRTAVSLDYDNNGTLEVYVGNNNDFGQLLTTSEPPGHWIQILAWDKHGHIGRLYRMAVDDGAQVRHAFGPATDAHLGSHDRRFHFGLGNRADAVSVRVEWLDGTETAFVDLRPNRLHLVSQTGDHCAVDDPARPARTCVERFGLGPPARMPEAAYNSKDRVADFNAAREQVLRSDRPDPRKPYPGVVEREYDTSVYWLIRNLQTGRQLCSTATTLSHLFDEEEAALRTKYMAVSHLAAALDRATVPERVCLLRALGHSERYRANRTVLRWLAATDDAVRTAAIIALGRLRQAESIEPLRSAVLELPPESAAEAAVSLEQIVRSAGEQAIGKRLATVGDPDRNALTAALTAANRKRPVAVSIEGWTRSPPMNP